jgi:hypothetical protein
MVTGKEKIFILNSSHCLKVIERGGRKMENERLCDCGSVADWAEIGSTWICVACREKDVKKNIHEFKEALGNLERAERALHMLKVDTISITELLSKLRMEINNIEM